MSAKGKTSRAKLVFVPALSIVYVLQGSLKVKRHLGTCIMVAQVLFRILIVVYLPTLDPYPGYTPLKMHMMNSREKIWFVLRGVPTYCQE